MSDPVTGYNRHPAFAWQHGIDAEQIGKGVPTLWEVPMALKNRISTNTLAGSAISVPSDYSFGEGVELRYSSAFTASQFQGIFCQVDTSVANTSTIRGGEFVGRRAGGAAVAVGSIMGLQIAGYTASGATGNITNLFGASIEAQTDAAYTGTITLFAGARVKLQAEDGATYTKSYGVVVEHEAVTGAKLVDAAFGAKSAATAAYKAVIDSREATLEAINTNQVRLFAFKDAAGNAKMVVYDPDDAAVLSVANYA
jgi:hypothetical protein